MQGALAAERAGVGPGPGGGKGGEEVAGGGGKEMQAGGLVQGVWELVMMHDVVLRSPGAEVSRRRGGAGGRAGGLVALRYQRTQIRARARTHTHTHTHTHTRAQYARSN